MEPITIIFFISILYLIIGAIIDGILRPYDADPTNLTYTWGLVLIKWITVFFKDLIRFLIHFIKT